MRVRFTRHTLSVLDDYDSDDDTNDENSDTNDDKMMKTYQPILA